MSRHYVQLYMYSTWAARTYIGAKQIVKLNKFKKKIWKYRPLLVQTYIKFYINIYCIGYIEVELMASSRQYLHNRRKRYGFLNKTNIKGRTVSICHHKYEYCMLPICWFFLFVFRTLLSVSITCVHDSFYGKFCHRKKY